MTYDSVQAEEGVTAIDRAVAGAGPQLSAETRDACAGISHADRRAEMRSRGPRKDTRMVTATVLVVDDLEGVRVLLGEVLGFYGYAVLSAASVPEAEAIRRRAGRGGLDLVITDLRLTHRPHAREGYDLIRRWQAVTPQLPCILVGGDLRPEDLPDLPRRGVWCLPKPFATAALLTTVAAALWAAPGARTSATG